MKVNFPPVKNTNQSLKQYKKNHQTMKLSTQKQKPKERKREKETIKWHVCKTKAEKKEEIKRHPKKNLS